MVVFVDFTIDGCGHLFVSVRTNMFLCNGWGMILVNRSSMLAVPGKEIGDCGFSFLHGEGI